MSADEGETAMIACDLCRARKRKCNRKVPACSQCTALSEACHYPVKLKRGIPTGYMNALESRLAETEKALFFALSELHSGVVVDGDYDSQPPHRSMLPQALSTAAPTHQLEKSDLMASWASQPLKNRAHAHAWLRSRQHHGPDALGPPAVNTTNGPHQTAPGPTVDSARNSKAKAFARENQELYF